MSKKKKNTPEPNKSKQSKVSIEKVKMEKRNLWIASAIIVVLTIIVYLPVFHNGFVNLDDDRYIEKQPLIKAFDFSTYFSIHWSQLFKDKATQPAFVMGNYHPLVMTVYSILYKYYQLNPVPYHTLNLILHIINSILVLWLFYYITSSFRIAVIVGLLFGIHPLHVESVAWASELKDLMYTVGFLCSLIFYVRYIKRNQSAGLYILSLLFFIFSLLSKGMGVSLAVLIFLIDFYLGRKFTMKTLLEKVPYVILAIVFGIIAIRAQKTLGAIQDIALFSPLQRVVFACYGFLTYIQRIFLPFNLCAYYPYPVKTNDTIPGIYYISPVILAALLAGVFLSLRKNKKIFFGIGFYAITVALVLQLLPVGGAITADRYSYIPSIGIFFLIAEVIVYFGNLASGNSSTRSNSALLDADAGASKKKKVSTSFNAVSLCLTAILTVYFSFLTFNQVKLWKDGMTLWTNVINNYQTVSLAYNNRGVLYKNVGDLNQAMDDYSRSLVLDPNNSDSWSNKGLIFWQEALGDNAHKAQLTDSALMYVNKAIKIKPDFATAYGNKGSILSTMGDQEGAIKAFTKSIELDPYFAESYYNRGIVKYNLHHGKSEESCDDLKRAAELGYAHSADAYRDLCK